MLFKSCMDFMMHHVKTLKINMKIFTHTHICNMATNAYFIRNLK